MAVYTYGVITDCGDWKTENQDSILCVTGNILLRTAASALFVVADGMGGLSWGSQVSSYITERFRNWWKEDFPAMMEAGRSSDEDIRELLEQEIWDINQAILDFREHMQCRCGSTLSLLLLYDGKYYIENMGDSRIYGCRHGKMKRLTQDQSLVAQYVREKKLTEDEAKKSAQKNILTMCLGMFDVPQSYFLTGKLKEGDVFLLCSDGLYNPLEPEEMEIILGYGEYTAQEKTEMLRRAVLPGEARDNVSAVIVHVSSN